MNNLIDFGDISVLEPLAAKSERSRRRSRRRCGSQIDDSRLGEDGPPLSRRHHSMNRVRQNQRCLACISGRAISRLSADLCDLCED